MILKGISRKGFKKIGNVGKETGHGNGLEGYCLTLNLSLFVVMGKSRTFSVIIKPYSVSLDKYHDHVGEQNARL